MPSTIITKNSITASAVPVSGDLTRGELALNLTDGRIYSKDEGTTIVELGINPSTIDITAGTIDNAVIGATTAVAGTFTNLTATGTLTGTLATAAQPNITSLGTIAALVATTADINGGTIDGTVIGGTTTAAISGTTGTFSTSLNVDGTATMDGLTSTTSSSMTQLTVNGTGAIESGINFANGGTTYGQIYFNNASPYDLSIMQQYVTGSLIFGTNDTERMRINSTGIDVTGTATMDRLTVQSTSASGTVASFKGSSAFGIELAASGVAPYIQTVSVGSGEELAITSGGNKVALFQDGGDISFYEDTGTTAKFFWDASAEKLNLTGAGGLDIASATGNVGFNYGTSPSPERGNLWYDTDGTGWKFNIGKVQSGSFTSQITIQDNGNVGIGTDSPSAKLDVVGEATFGSGSYGVKLTYSNSATAGVIDTANSADKLSIRTGGTERMRIDASGNVLVGTTEVDVGYTDSGAGASIDQSGVIQSARSSVNANLYLNKLDNDGEIINFRKDGTTVGSIGTLGRLTIGNASTGLSFNSSTVAVQPHNMTTNGATSDTIDLGVSGARFKDLHLSGGVYLGGTGSANKLDDYEEGTWTPTVAGDATGVLESPAVGGYYTKVGNQVTVYFNLRVTTNFTSSSIGGLPFQVDHESMSSSWVYAGNCLTGANNTITAGLQNTTGVMRLYDNQNINDTHSPNTTNEYYRFQFSYRTNS
jgi:hypothetical protein